MDRLMSMPTPSSSSEVRVDNAPSASEVTPIVSVTFDTAPASEVAPIVTAPLDHVVHPTLPPAARFDDFAGMKVCIIVNLL